MWLKSRKKNVLPCILFMLLLFSSVHLMVCLRVWCHSSSCPTSATSLKCFMLE